MPKPRHTRPRTSSTRVAAHRPNPRPRLRPQPARCEAERPPEAPPPAPTGAIVVVGPHSGFTFDLADGLTIGRKGCDINLPEDGQVSRTHARFHHSPERATIEDAGSTNGTVVKGRKLEPHKPVEVHTGDIIELGETHLKLL